jgi:hypothetical protein
MKHIFVRPCALENSITNTYTHYVIFLGVKNYFIEKIKFQITVYI